jgi:hypothetical protein
MDKHIFQAVGDWIIRIFALLGGATGIIRIGEWLLSRPKIIGEIEQSIIGTLHQGSDNALVGANLMLQLYVVNTRLRPTTVRGWHLDATVKGKRHTGETWAIPDNFVLREDNGNVINIDWASARLYDKAATNLLEYGKGTRGWLRFVIRGLTGDDLRVGGKLRITITDAVGKKHRIKYETSQGDGELRYYPGAGVAVG